MCSWSPVDTPNICYSFQTLIIEFEIMFNVSLRALKIILFSPLSRIFFKNILTVIIWFKILDFCPCDYKSLEVMRNMNVFWSMKIYTSLLWLMKDKSQKFIIRVEIIIHNLIFSQRINHFFLISENTDNVNSRREKCWRKTQ